MFKRLIAVGGLLACASLRVLAQEGYPDPTFGTDGVGVGTTTFTGTAYVYPEDTAVLPDGRILTLSMVVQDASTNETKVGLARFNVDGTPDTSFSFDGQVLADFGGDNTYNVVHAMAVQPDGKILVCGASVFTGGDHSEFTVMRFAADGTLDASFGEGGKVHVPFDEHTNSNVAICMSMALQRDGKIVLAGYALVAPGSNDDFAVARLLPDGSLDTAFASGGKRYIAFDFAGSSLRDKANSVAIDQDGSLYVAGAADHGSGSTVNYDMAIAKLTPQGDLDANFDTDGKMTIAFDRGGSNDDEAFQVLIQRNGRVLVVGSAIGSATAGNYDFAVVRLFPDGSADTSYGPNGTGRLRVPFDLYAGGVDICMSGMLTSDGELVLAGLAALAPNYSVLGFARLHNDGTLDPDFGQGGLMHFSSTELSHLAIAVHPRSQGGRIVVAVGNYVQPDFAQTVGGVARLQTDLIFADGF